MCEGLSRNVMQVMQVVQVTFPNKASHEPGAVTGSHDSDLM